MGPPVGVPVLFNSLVLLGWVPLGSVVKRQGCVLIMSSLSYPHHGKILGGGYFRDNRTSGVVARDGTSSLDYGVPPCPTLLCKSMKFVLLWGTIAYLCQWPAALKPSGICPILVGLKMAVEPHCRGGPVLAWVRPSMCYVVVLHYCVWDHGLP